MGQAGKPEGWRSPVLKVSLDWVVHLPHCLEEDVMIWVFCWRIRVWALIRWHQMMRKGADLSRLHSQPLLSSPLYFSQFWVFAVFFLNFPAFILLLKPGYSLPYLKNKWMVGAMKLSYFLISFFSTFSQTHKNKQTTTKTKKHTTFFKIFDFQSLMILKKN